jgi:hypothetical protein
MRSSIIIIENFYEDPDAVREYALRQRYYYPYQPNADVESGRVRFNWMTSWFKSPGECPFKSSTDLLKKLEWATGDTIDMEHWNRPFPTNAEGKAAAGFAATSRSCLWNCCFHFKPETAQKLGEGVHNHVTDVWNESGANGWNGLIYLSTNAPVSGGLKIWRHHNPERKYDWMTPKENWEMVDDLGNLYNRLILCRGNLPHSGADGWGANLENGRLFQTFFFQVKGFEEQASLRLAL